MEETMGELGVIKEKKKSIPMHEAPITEVWGRLNVHNLYPHISLHVVVGRKQLTTTTRFGKGQMYTTLPLHTSPCLSDKEKTNLNHTD